MIARSGSVIAYVIRLKQMKTIFSFAIGTIIVFTSTGNVQDETAKLKARVLELEREVDALTLKLKRETKARVSAQTDLLFSVNERLPKLGPNHHDYRLAKQIAVELAPTYRGHPGTIWSVLHGTQALENLTLEEAEKLLGANGEQEPGEGLGGGESPIKREPTHYFWVADTKEVAPPVLRAEIIDGKLRNWSFGN